MIVDKNGRVVANVSQPTIIFDTEAAYDAWKENLPSEDSEKDFIIIKTYEPIVKEFATLADLKAISASEKKEGIVYYVDRLLNGLTQKIEFRYNETDEIFVPVTNPIEMDGPSFQSFLYLMGSEKEFNNYNLIFKLYKHQIMLDFEFDRLDTPPHAYFDKNLKVIIEADLPEKNPTTNLKDFLRKFSNYYLRGSKGFTADSDYSTKFPVIIDSYHTDGESHIEDFQGLYINIEKHYPATPLNWSQKLELNDFSNVKVKVVLPLAGVTASIEGETDITKCLITNSVFSDNVIPKIGV